MSTGIQFAGKYLQVFIEKPANGGTFENCRIDSVGGQDCLVGTLIAHPYHPDLRTGLSFWMPTNQIQMIVEFPNRDAVLKYIEDNRRRKEEEKAVAPQRSWWRRR